MNHFEFFLFFPMVPYQFIIYKRLQKDTNQQPDKEICRMRSYKGSDVLMDLFELVFSGYIPQ